MYKRQEQKEKEQAEVQRQERQGDAFHSLICALNPDFISLGEGSEHTTLVFTDTALAKGDIERPSIQGAAQATGPRGGLASSYLCLEHASNKTCSGNDVASPGIG